jgi:hypothetical protein
MLYPLSYEGGAPNVPLNRRSEAVHRRTIEGSAQGVSEAAHWEPAGWPSLDPISDRAPGSSDARDALTCGACSSKRSSRG